MGDDQVKPQSSADSELGRVVVEKGLATAGEVVQCRAELEAAAGPDPGSSLGGVLLKKGIITAGQLQRVIDSLDEMHPAQQIPGYRILSRLGAGAMATVFLARQLSLDRKVAIKVLPMRFSENPEYVERFYKEGQAAAKLNHSNIVQAFDVGETGGYHYFVMEYVEGHTLHDELEKGKGFSETEALRIITQIARALAHAHERGLIHRDVKPKNIMMTPDGTAKLADMGLARLAADEQAAQAEAGKAYGTPYYIAPEQIRGELDIDFRADIYALGATLYHLVTGRVPFDGETPAAVMHKHLKELLAPPDHVNAALSVGVGEVVEVMMAKSRDQRYASTSDLIADLEAVARGEPPLLAHKAIDPTALRELGEGEEPTAATGAESEQGLWSPSAALFYAILAALAISILVNFIQAIL